MATVEKTEKNIDHLNSFLRGELSAVETYRQALDRVSATSPARPQLANCLRSHEDRVYVLKQAIVSLGGTPADGSGAWGIFARAVEGSASVLGDKLAITALEEGEDHGLKDYRGDLTDLDFESQQLVTSKLLPLQEETHRAMRALKKQLH